MKFGENDHDKDSDRPRSRWKSAPERFWSQVRKTDGCWTWTGLIVRRYGTIHADGRSVRAHRFSARLHGMNIDGTCVLHRCDNPLCVRPDHLFLGTHADNNRDMRSKGRARSSQPGARNPRARLTESQVRAIRQRLAEGGDRIGQRLADEFLISRVTISHIKHNRRWTCVA